MKKDENIRQDQESPGNSPAPVKRSFGQRAFDFFLYPVVTNLGVFAVSVWATYMSTKRPSINPSGLEKLMQARGTWLERQFAKVGIVGETSKNFRIVSFSFLDGSVLAPVVKLFEDRRNDIARSIDKAVSDKPVDERVYSNEPKQSWTSVLGGRAVTAGIVAPTAIALDKIKPKAWMGDNINDRLFNNPGKELAKWVEKKPNIQKMVRSLPGMKHVQVSELAKVSLFEAFYTTVCTVGLYYSSRAIARAQQGNKDTVYDAPISGEVSALTQEIEEKPKAKVSGKEAKHDAPVEWVQRV